MGMGNMGGKPHSVCIVMLLTLENKALRCFFLQMSIKSP